MGKLQEDEIDKQKLMLKGINDGSVTLHCLMQPLITDSTVTRN